eukprot:scaffold7628_cov165-Skeletonema_marinoi.AAC.1
MLPNPTFHSKSNGAIHGSRNITFGEESTSTSAQTCYSDGYPGITSCCRKLARERRKRSLPARAETAKNLFHHLPQSSLTHHGAAMSRVRPAMSSQIQELDNQHYVRFDRHAIAVAAIGDDCNKL